MKTKLAVTGMILVGIVGCAHMAGMEEKEKIHGKNPPVIGQSFASDRLNPGGLWKIYLQASDPDGDMEAILAAVDQPGIGAYPASITRIKGENGKELSGYIFLNTSGQRDDDFLDNQELEVSVQIRDKAGHTSKPITHKVLILARQTQKEPPPGVFKEEALGPIMVVLQPVTGGRR